MADEATDVKDAEITLDDFNSDETDTKADSSTAKSEAKAEDKTQAKDTKEVVQADDTVTPPDVPTKTDTEDKEDKNQEVDETVADKPTKADERKAELNKDIEESKKALNIDPNTEIRDLVSARNAIKEAVTTANSEVYQPATEDELVEQGLSTTDAKVEALRQEIEMRNYNEKVADAQLTLSSESERVLRDFPQFNPDSDNFDKELAEEAAELLAGNLIIDPNTEQIIGSNISPYQLYKTLARASGTSEVKGQLKGQQAAEEMAANADEVGSVAPEKKAQTATDKLVEMWKSDD